MQWGVIEGSLSTLRAVEGGFSDARRGIVTMPDGASVFVKLAVDEKTAGWIESEKKAYHWLEQAGYQHAPRLLAEGPNGFALADLSACDWSHTWNDAKVMAMLKALDDLAALPVDDSDFTQSVFPPNSWLSPHPWRSLPDDATPYTPFLDDPALLQAVDSILRDTALRERYATIADSEPWRGTRPVHYDARSDNFAYDQVAGMGYLVDWNWMGLGNPLFDVSSLLVNVQLAGYDVLAKHRERLDKASLVWLMGFWLKTATGPRDSERLRRLRPRQVRNALTTHALIQQL